jgi:hypothetical protein
MVCDLPVDILPKEAKVVGIFGTFAGVGSRKKKFLHPKV